MKIATISLAAACLAALCLPAAAQQTRDVETIMGTVTIPADAEHVMVLNPLLAGALFALDIEVESVPRSWQDTTEEGYSGYWADAARAADTQVMEVDFGALNLEYILGFNPDLIIAGSEGVPGNQTRLAYEALSEIAPTVFLDPLLPTWQDDIRFIAEVFDRHAEADALIADFDRRVAALRGSLALPPQPVAFILAPFGERADAYSIPEDSATPHLFAQLGFEVYPLHATFPELERGMGGAADWGWLSLENTPAIYDEPATLFILTDNRYGASPVTLGAALELFRTHPIFSRIPAVARGEVMELPAFTYRFDYYGALETLAYIGETFAE